MTEILVSEALTNRTRLLGRTSGEYKGNVFKSITNGTLIASDPDLGVVRRKLFSATPVHITIGKKPPRGFESKQDYELRAKAEDESIDQLMKNTEELYEKIIESNAQQRVTINGKEMSVAFAIVYRDVFLPRKQEQLDVLTHQYQRILTEVDTINERAKREVDTIITQSSQTEKPNAEESKKAYEFHMNNREAKIVDPLRIKDRIDKLQTEIDIITGDLKTQVFNSNNATNINWSPES